MEQHTPFYANHLSHHARMVPFFGWMMPLHYGSQLEEHHFVRNRAGIFDVSHMGVVDVQGEEAEAFLAYLFANDVTRLAPNKALYTCMLNQTGGVIDDLIVYKKDQTSFRLVINAGCRDKDIAWLKHHAASFKSVEILERKNSAMIALQGPKASELLAECVPSKLAEAAASLKPFHAVWMDDWFIARTGYTGEDGFEMVFPSSHAAAFCEAVDKASIPWCGLGARDTLRLEAGFNLYGQDMDETISPLAANLSWTVAMPDDQSRDFIGLDALLAEKARNVLPQLRGAFLASGGILRRGQVVHLQNGMTGEVTSGGYSPSLEKSIAFVRLPFGDFREGSVEIRQKRLPITIVALPFWRRGKSVY